MHVIEHPLGITEFVKRVADQHGIGGACGQARIVFGSEDDVNVMPALQNQSGP